MTRRTAALVAAVLACLSAAGCGNSDSATSTSTARTPDAAPEVVLTDSEKEVWAPLPPDRSQIPVLLYHGIGLESDFKDRADAEYGINAYDFAKQMTLIKHAGFQTVDLRTFVRFAQGKAVHLPPRPLLLTFDDGRTDSWTGSDEILRKLGFTAVMFVDAGRVDQGDPEYLTWQELQTMQRSGRWETQLHSGNGHIMIRWGPNPEEVGPFYAYREVGESFEGWEHRSFSDIEWGEEQLASHVSGYEPLAFAPPYGNYGQDGTNDARIPDTLLTWLKERFDVIFTQDRSWFAKPNSAQPLGRFQITRATSGGDLHHALVSPP